MLTITKERIMQHRFSHGHCKSDLVLNSDYFKPSHADKFFFFRLYLAFYVYSFPQNDRAIVVSLDIFSFLIRVT